MRKRAGRACPAPTGWWKGERVPAGNGQAEGSRPLPTVWGEAGCKAVTGGSGKCAGRACPAPTGVMVEGAVYFQHPACVNVENTCNFYLIIIV